MPGPPFERSFEFVEHTADIAVRLRGDRPERLFEAAAHAFTEALTDRAGVKSTAIRRVKLTGSELDLLLVDWLNELLFLFETQGFLVRDSEVQIARPESVPTPTADVTKDAKSRKEEQEGPLEMNSSCDLRDEYVICATLHGDTRDAARHPLKVLIKGVTYHGLHVAKSERGCEATVIFDI